MKVRWIAAIVLFSVAGLVLGEMERVTRKSIPDDGTSNPSIHLFSKVGYYALIFDKELQAKVDYVMIAIASKEGEILMQARVGATPDEGYESGVSYGVHVADPSLVGSSYYKVFLKGEDDERYRVYLKTDISE